MPNFPVFGSIRNHAPIRFSTFDTLRRLTQVKAFGIQNKTKCGHTLPSTMEAEEFHNDKK